MPKNRKREIRGSYIVAIDGEPVFDQASILHKFNSLREQLNKGFIKSFTVDIAPLPKNNRKTVWKECDEHDIFIPDPHADNSESALSVHSLTSIARLRCDDDDNSVEPTMKKSL